ncbi:25934_t:CDS:2, partial [Dentiscutata erythropus]
MSEQIIEIPRENSPPHNGKEITKIVCSPKLKYIATWSDKDMSACIYSIEDQMNLKYEDCYSLKEQIQHGLSKEIECSDFLNAKKFDLKLSDQKHIALMPYNEDEDLRHAALFALERHEMKILKPCDNKKEIIESNFIFNNNCDYYLLVRRETNSKNRFISKSYSNIDHELNSRNYGDNTNSITGYIFELSGKRRESLLVTYKRNEENNFNLLDPYIFTESSNKETEDEYPYACIFTEKFHEETEKLPELGHPYLINYSMVFCIDKNENKLKVQKFSEFLENKLNNMNSNLVAEE